MIKNFFKAIAVFFALPFFAVPAYAGHGSAPEPAEEEVVEPEIGYYAITPDLKSKRQASLCTYQDESDALRQSRFSNYCRRRTSD